MYVCPFLLVEIRMEFIAVYKTWQINLVRLSEYNAFILNSKLSINPLYTSRISIRTLSSRTHKLISTLLFFLYLDGITGTCCSTLHFVWFHVDEDWDRSDSWNRYNTDVYPSHLLMDGCFPSRRLSIGRVHPSYGKKDCCFRLVVLHLRLPFGFPFDCYIIRRIDYQIL